MKTAILTDTNSGISPSEAERLDIYVMPMPVIMDEKIYYEGENMPEDVFYQTLSSGKQITTSQPSPGDVLDKWEELLATHEELVYIPMSSGLSNSCQAAIGLAGDYSDRVYVIDNHRISVTLRIAVLTAKQMADEGYTAKQIKDSLEQDAYNSTIYLAVNSLEHLRRGGRITSSAAMLGTVLQIKPILTIQGELLDLSSKVRGNMKKCELKMIEAVKRDIADRFCDVKTEDLHIGAAGAGLTEAEIDEWTGLLKGEFPTAHIFYDPLPASIAVHTGPGAVGIGVCVR